MKNVILLSTAVAAAIGTVAYMIKRKRKTSHAAPEMAKRSYHKTDVFSKAKNHLQGSNNLHE